MGTATSFLADDGTLAAGRCGSFEGRAERRAFPSDLKRSENRIAMTPADIAQAGETNDHGVATLRSTGPGSETRPRNGRHAVTGSVTEGFGRLPRVFGALGRPLRRSRRSHSKRRLVHVTCHAVTKELTGRHTRRVFKAFSVAAGRR